MKSLGDQGYILGSDALSKVMSFALEGSVPFGGMSSYGRKTRGHWGWLPVNQTLTLRALPGAG